MARALRYVCDSHDISPVALKSLTQDQLDKLQSYAIAVGEEMEYNQLKYFRPFDYQLDFYKTGTQCDRRGILAANRVGKTVSTCYEAAMHLTGLYPEWWPAEAKRFTKPVTIFAAGESWPQVAMVLQNELMGAPDGKLTQQLGTGSIPRNAIVFDTMRSDGANIISVEIKHVSGQRSRLVFGNYTQEVRNLQGFKLDLCILDEQPPDDFFSELVTRTATTQGQVLCSFTPLKGLNGLVSKFWEREDGYEFVRVAWDNVPEYDLWGQPFLLNATRQQLMRDFMPHEREARMAGKPVMGHGAIFPLKSWPTYKQGDYNFEEMSNIQRIIALDLGMVNDATVISLMYWDDRNKEAWLDRQLVITPIKKQSRIDQLELDEANPVGYIQHLMRPEVFGCPIVLPADASTVGRYTMSSSSIRELFEEYGLNVYEKPIMNPQDSQGRVTNLKSYGINIMRQMLEFGTLHVNENCQTFLSEARNYNVDEKGRYSDPDDAIDSCRYALLGCLNGIAEPVNGGRNQKVLQAKNAINSIKAQRTDNRVGWRAVMDPNGN